MLKICFLFLYIFQFVLKITFYLVLDAIYKNLKVFEIYLKKLLKFKLDNKVVFLILGFILYLFAIDNIL